MSAITEKTAYLRGLVEGLGITGDDPQGKITLALISTLEEAAQEIETQAELLAELSDVVDEIDSNLGDLEEVFWSDAMDDEAYDPDEEPDDGLIEYECPNCGTVVMVNQDVFDLEDEHVCPECGQKILGEKTED